MDKLHELVGHVKQQWFELGRTPTKAEFIEQYGNEHYFKTFQYYKLIDAAGLEHPKFSRHTVKNKPKILFLDIETAPIQAFIWRLYDETVGINQIIKDWHLLSWSAKWLGSDEIFYQDQRNQPDMTNDKEITQGICELINQADILVGHNIAKFDIKKINTRCMKYGLKPPTHYRLIDTLRIAKGKFGFTSNKLEYLAIQLLKIRKMTKRKFAGFSLWEACLDRNMKAWDEMEKYNKQDVIVLEQIYNKLIPWDGKINFSPFYDGLNVCRCGSEEMKQDGHIVTNTGKFLRYVCLQCGANYQDKKNMLSPKDMLKAL